MAALAFRSAVDGGDTSLTTSSVAVSLPSGTASGDLMTVWAGAAVFAPSSAPTISTPSGWTLAGSQAVSIVSGAINARLHLFYKVAGASEGSVTLDTGGTNAIFTYARQSYRNPAASPFGQVSWGSGGPGTSAALGSLTTTSDNALLAAFVAQGVAQNITPPASMTERVDNATFGIAAADEVFPEAGAAGTRTFTLPSSSDYAWGIAEFASAVTPPDASSIPYPYPHRFSRVGRGGRNALALPRRNGDSIQAVAEAAFFGETTGATGTAAASNANDTASASGTTTVTGASARTAANDTSSASGTTTVAGTLARTNAGDTASASGSVGSPITGTVAATNAGDTSSAAGTTTVTGASARTAGNDSASAAGTTTVLGTAARTNADDTGSASGSVGGAVSGTAAVTAADDTAAASGTTAVTGAVSATAGNDTATASGAAGAVSGSAAATGGDDTASAAGATAGGQQSGGWGQSSNRKPRDYTPTAEQIHAERVRLGILPAEEAPAAVAESAPVSSSAPAAAKPLAVPSLSRVEIDAAAIVAANEAIRAAIAAAQQEELSRLVWESVQQDEAAVVALIAELV